ncbi:hypothetical protein GRF91_004688 [Salmonella enterica]|nr:hypothetical protein [Salmonella enterica]
MTITDAAFRGLPALNPLQCDMLKLVAFVAMVLDHVNTASGLNIPLLQAVGRLAFPLFALVWGCNVVRRPVTQAGLNRLWLMALLAQPGFWLAFRDIGVQGVSLDIENYCTLRLFFDLSTLAGLSRRNLPETGIRLLFQI